ncbi:WD40 repeat domain-containing protein [Arcobacter sp. LA11]|uniref:WD40 repeat domain-containing protein n=1 Tax=Arcobacter sp. LA11 TaxID=1898176 RepID=UPI000934ED12|nr:WD40 repeat domain-containing protein [Arcobacter sp. LA11]
MKLLISLLFSFSLLFSQNLKPTQTYLASGGVTDLVLKENLLYISTDASLVDIFDVSSSELVNSIKIPQIKDFIGDLINTKIYSVDVMKNKVILVAQGEKGFRNIYEYSNNKLTPIITIDKKMYIAKAKYLNEDLIILGLLSNQIFVYNLKEKKFVWEVQASQSKFSNFVLNEDKSKVIIADESGSLKQLNTKNGKVEKIYSGLNVDNVFQVDIKKEIIITAGQDRRCAIYQKYNQYYKKADFLIYSVGLSPSGKLAGFANNEDNDITIFNTKSKKELYTLKGHKMTLTNILFKNENELYSSSDDNEVYYWKLK